MKKGRVTVLGSFVSDLMTRSPHLPVSGETVRGSMFQYVPGGKGSNQAIAAHRAGAAVQFITKVGTDLFADAALAFYREEKLDSTYIYQTDAAPTGAALIMVDEASGANKIVVVPGAADCITPAEIERARPAIEQADVFLTQLETNLDAVEAAVAIAHAARVRVVLNPAPAQAVSDDLLSKVDVLTPNETEASILTGIEVNSEASALHAAQALLSRGVKAAMITLGDKGAVLVTREGVQQVAALKVNAIDTTGAGDAFSGGLATALAEGKALQDAARFASVTAGLSVTGVGTAPAMPMRVEIDRALGAEQKE